MSEIQLQFASINLKNYKAFNDITIDFMDTQKKAKKLVTIYGENGVGKSTIISTLKNLRLSLDTRNNRSKIDKITKIMDDSNYKSNFDDLLELLKTTGPSSFKEVFKDVPTINNKENTVTEIKYNFFINKKSGSYYLKFNNRELLEEKLEFTIKKNKGVLFDISHENIKLNKSLFDNQILKHKIKDLIEAYWSKHSFLSIIDEIIEQENFNLKTISENLLAVIFAFDHICISDSNVSYFFSSLPSLLKGQVPNDKKHNDLLKNSQKAIKSFFKKINSNIQDVKYKTSLSDDNLNYELILTEKINDKFLDINCRLLSDGTRSVINLLPFLTNIANGCVVAIDELDKDIHDLLLINLVSAINNIDINGQLIFSTHNTLIMDTIGPKYIYCINSDRHGKRSINKLEDFKRFSNSSKISKQYREGNFQGIPYMSDLDLSYLTELLEDSEE